MLTHGAMGRMVLAERICFLIQAPLPHSLQAFSIGYVTVHHCQQARYVHQFVRINRLACIIDDEEDLRGMESPTAWCAKCETNVELIEASKPL